MAAEPLMTTGDLAARTGLSLRSIRYYEEVGLALPLQRSKGGHRLYDHVGLERIQLIMKMKPLDFTLEQMGSFFLALDTLRDTSAKQAVRSEARDKLAMFSSLVDQRCEWLRERLTIAEEFRAQLREELAQPRRRGRPRK